VCVEEFDTLTWNGGGSSNNAKDHCANQKQGKGDIAPKMCLKDKGSGISLAFHDQEEKSFTELTWRNGMRQKYMQTHVL